MDYTISNHFKLFDDVLAVLQRYCDKPGVAGAFDDLLAAKKNYQQRSLDHMLNCLVLVLHDLVIARDVPGLMDDLSRAIHDHYRRVLESSNQLASLAQEYELSGGPPLSYDQIAEEIARRRGGAR